MDLVAFDGFLLGARSRSLVTCAEGIPLDEKPSSRRLATVRTFRLHLSLSILVFVLVAEGVFSRDGIGEDVSFTKLVLQFEMEVEGRRSSLTWLTGSCFLSARDVTQSSFGFPSSDSLLGLGVVTSSRAISM